MTGRPLQVAVQSVERTPDVRRRTRAEQRERERRTMSSTLRGRRCQRDSRFEQRGTELRGLSDGCVGRPRIEKMHLLRVARACSFSLRHHTVCLARSTGPRLRTSERAPVLADRAKSNEAFVRKRAAAVYKGQASFSFGRRDAALRGQRRRRGQRESESCFQRSGSGLLWP